MLLSTNVDSTEKLMKSCVDHLSKLYIHKTSRLKVCINWSVGCPGNRV
jgi:hypothetical protein